MQDLTKVDINSTTKPTMVLDLDNSYLGKDIYNYARNAIPTTQDGNMGTVSNEPSTILCVTTTYPIIGHVTLPNKEILLFSTDNTTSEIGILNEQKCTYRVVSNLDLGFSTYEPPITGVARKDFNQNTLVTFGNISQPTRTITLETLSTITDKDKLLTFKKVSIPCLRISQGIAGNIPNGTYSVAIAYSIDKQKISDYFAITTRNMLWKEGGGHSLVVNVEQLDSDYNQYELVLIGNVNGTITAERVGWFSYNTKSINITDFNNPTRTEILLEQLVIRSTTWKSAGIITANSNYLILADLVKRKEISYQRQAMEIKVKYVVDQVPLNYYDKGQDIGYYRDENYDFHIEGVYNTGEFTSASHIAGRVATATDLSLASGEDVYELDEKFCDKPQSVKRWQVENTASEMTYLNEEFKCDRRTLGYGEMGYFESTEPYPNNEFLYGKYANTPQRFHKMPDECKVPRYSVIDGVTYINILGIQLENIQPFVDENGDVIPDIVGYRITRSDRKGGNRTVIARGLFTNVRGYTDSQTQTKVLYSNYPVNDLNPDIYLSSTQTIYKNKREQSFSPLTQVYNDKFNFYSPHTNFNEKYVLGNEVKMECEEIGVVKGRFEPVLTHPKHKLLTQWAFWIASTMGTLEALLVTTGKTTITAESEFEKKTTAIDPGTIKKDKSTDTTNLQSAKDLLGVNPIKIVTDAAKALKFDASFFRNIRNILLGVAAGGLKIATFGMWAIDYANQIIDIIRKTLGYTQYAWQYNGVTKFTQTKCVTPGNKRRRTLYQPVYLSPDNHSIRDFVYNNSMRESVVMVELAKPLLPTTTKDNSRVSISSAGLDTSGNKVVESQAVAYYGTSKNLNPNQYGAIGSTKKVIVQNCINYFENKKGETYSSPVFYGGDCIIGPFQMMKKLRFFSQDLATTFGNELPPNFPDGTEFDYRQYPNLAFPRYYGDFTPYDYSQLFKKNIVNSSTFTRTTTAKYNLDGIVNDKENIFRVDDAYFYLSNNTVLDFIVEADYNINFRENTDRPHYSKSNTNLTELFKPHISQFPEKFKLDKAFYDIYTTEVFSQQIRDNFTPETAFPEKQPNSVIYSLPSYNLQAIDNWKFFLPLNYFSFREGDFGELTGIHKIDQDRLLFTFSNSSPFVSMGRDFLELDGTGRKITIGDGGLFAQDPRETAPTETDFGSSKSRYAFKNTNLGRYYPSLNAGKYFNFKESPEEINKQGLYYWLSKYMSFQLKEHFDYDLPEDPINSIGYVMAFDQKYELIYLTKRDFIPIQEIEFKDSKFYCRGLEVFLRDENYFKDISWTLSYSPVNQGFVSFHDWHPDWVIQTNNHFLTVKGNTVWKHNQSYDSFGTFYGKKQPFEVTMVSTGGVEVIRSIEYILECYRYKNFGRDKFHVLNQNFDRLNVFNSEQASPNCNLVLSTNNPYQDVEYPKVNGKNMDVLFSKEENKYRINQFADLTRDRGEFTNKEYHLFATDESGYKQTLNEMAVDVNKPQEEWKKFRHYFTKFKLSKLEQGDIQMVFKILQTKKTQSPR